MDIKHQSVAYQMVPKTEQVCLYTLYDIRVICACHTPQILDFGNFFIQHTSQYRYIIRYRIKEKNTTLLDFTVEITNIMLAEVKAVKPIFVYGSLMAEEVVLGLLGRKPYVECLHFSGESLFIL